MTDLIRVYQAPAHDLPMIADGSVQAIMLSSPYYGLRAYAGEQDILWPTVEYAPMPGLHRLKVAGCDPACAHEWVAGPREHKRGPVGASTLQGGPMAGGVGRIQSITHGRYCVRCGGWKGPLGQEPTPVEFVAHIVLCAREWRRVLRPDGVLFFNIGDSYANDSKWGGATGGKHAQGLHGEAGGRGKRATGLKAKDLIGIPWRVAFALQADGWTLRSSVVWCLSGGTYLYARTPRAEGPMMVRDIARLNPETVQLWNGEKWTRLLGVSKSKRRGDELEIVLRSGECIACTPTHRFPTGRGLLEASAIRVGDTLTACRLPEPNKPRDCALDEDAAWFAGLYIAEGSRSDDTIQIAGHAKEEERWLRIQRIAAKFGGSATRTVSGNDMSIRLHGKILIAVLDELVGGKTAIDKHFGPVVWRYSNRFLAAMVDGYLAGDGHLDGKRWRLGFCRNYSLARDLRTACARLGYRLTLNLSSVKYNGGTVPSFRGELRKETSGHWNEKDRNEVMEVRKARCREVYDLGVEDEPHLFALASGILTHNSKPNPLPEPVKDRPSRSHEDIFIFSQAERYYWDAEAVREENSSDTQRDHNLRYAKTYKAYDDRAAATGQPGNVNNVGIHARPGPPGRNLRSVWTVTPQPFPGAHYAVWPAKLVETMVLASTSERGACPTCGAPWRRVIERGRPVPRVDNPNAALPYDADSGHNHGQGATTLHLERSTSTLGWLPGCACYGMPAMPDLPDEPETPEGIEAGAPVTCPVCEGRGELAGPPLFPDDVTVCARCKGKGGRPASAAWMAWRAEMDAWQAEYERIMNDLIRPLLAMVDVAMATVPCVVLDPFAGSGTTGAVAAAKGRAAILTDLSGVYLEGLVRQRTTVQIELPRL